MLHAIHPHAAPAAFETMPDLVNRDARILADLQAAALRLHVVSQAPRVLVVDGPRDRDPHPVAWQALCTRSVGASPGALAFRGAPAATLPLVLRQGFDAEPQLGETWAHARLAAAMAEGPVVQLVRADRLPDDVARALVGVLVFEEDGLTLDAVRTAAIEAGLTPCGSG
jgi:hypothetical protein